MSGSGILEFLSKSPDETRGLGERLGRRLQTGTVLLLHGDLGAGKTTLTQGIAVGLGVTDYVQSPTFTLVAEHEGSSARLYHLDLYRLEDETELESFGYDHYLNPPDGVTVIEWPERAGNWLPDNYLLMELLVIGDNQRALRLSSHGTLDVDLEALCTRPGC